MKEHELKTWPEAFQAVEDGRKTFEFRRDDGRDFALGDALVLREWDPDAPPETEGPSFFAQEKGRYTGRKKRVFVTYIARGPAYGIPEEYVVMSIDHYYSGRVPGDEIEPQSALDQP